jgi:glycosyltransferase involved in cell wall biosynthesis
MKNILFVTWDGPQTNYLESLFIPIFSRLNKLGYQFSILQFSWASKEQIKYNNEICERAGITYRHITVWRKPSVAIGSMLSALKGSIDIKRAVKDWNIDVLIPRSMLPALATLIAKKSFTDVKLVFDADGLPLDERVDFGNANPTSLIHRFLRDVENQAVIRSEHVITRSQIANNILQNRAGAGTELNKFSVVTNGRNTELFKLYNSDNRLQVRNELAVDTDAPILVYAGSLGPQYCIKQMLMLFSEVKMNFPNSKLLILSGDFSSFYKNTTGYEHLLDDVITKSLRSDEVGKYLSACDLGLAIRQPSFSMQAVAPIKLGEYLLCGLPVVVTKGIGDTQMVEPSIGYLLPENDNDNIKSSAKWFIKNFMDKSFDKEIINNVGMSHFSVESSVQRYHQVLKSL